MKKKHTYGRLLAEVFKRLLFTADSMLLLIQSYAFMQMIDPKLRNRQLCH